MMKSNYQKYYDTLKGKDYSAPISKYTSALNEAKSKVESAETIINSSVWIEKGLEIIKSSVMPSLKEQTTQIENGITALTSAVSKEAELVSKLTELEAACNEYDAADKDKKAAAQDKVTKLEGEVDSLIEAINGIAFEYSDKKAAFTTTMTELKDSTSIEAKRLEFIGDPKDTSKYYLDPNYPNIRKDLMVFDNTTGEILNDEDTIYLKKGETRVLTVKLPYNAGKPTKIVRTTAADVSGPSDTHKITTSKSDINPDPNKVDYVNYQYNHWPSGVDLNTNYYEWIITADSTGSRQISQTCEYETAEGGTPKSMIGINVVIVDG